MQSAIPHFLLILPGIWDFAQICMSELVSLGTRPCALGLGWATGGAAAAGEGLIPGGHY